ncbi:MAG: hypothetical protein KA419_13455 [Acidobacteria bacterium]|nr:hypothetical protein [Acidobacteriota bacterium]
MIPVKPNRAARPQPGLPSVRRRSRALATGLALLLAAPGVLPAKEKVNVSPASGSLHALRFPGNNPATGLAYNASGVVTLPDGRALFVDNRCSRALYAFSLSGDLRLSGSIRPLKLDLSGPPPEDLEGLTLVRGGDRPVLVGVCSQSIKRKSKTSRAARGSLVRMEVDGDRVRAESMPGFRDWLVRNVSRLTPIADLADNRGGINVEGLAWDPRRNALVLGFRNPLAEGRPMLLPVRVKDWSGDWTPDNLEAGEPIRLNVAGGEGGLGVRGIEYDSAHGNFPLILGDASRSGKAPFRLAVWDGGDAGRATLVPGVSFAPGMKPESLSRTVIGGRGCLLIVDDGGGCLVIPEKPQTAAGRPAGKPARRPPAPRHPD